MNPMQALSAVPIAVHEALFQREFLQISVERYQINRTSK